MTGSDYIVRAQAITNQLVHDLCIGEICAIIVPEYVSPRVQQILVSYIAKARPVAYTHEIHNHVSGDVETIDMGVERIGLPYNSTLTSQNKPLALYEYYEQALPTIQFMRKITDPYLSPIDKLRLELDENWPGGAQIARFDDLPMLCGIIRVMKPEKSKASEFPHFDALPIDVREFAKQLAANIFLSLPLRGGELLIWNVKSRDIGEVLTDEWVHKAPSPIVVDLHPRDLVIFNSRQPHAIREFKQGIRSSIQTFIGVDKTLQLWN